MAQCVYLLHFHSKLKHAQHYIGWTRHLEERIRHHHSGTGAKITAACSREGIDFEVVRKWENKDGNFERKLHKQKQSKLLCPICSGEKAYGRMKG